MKENLEADKKDPETEVRELYDYFNRPDRDQYEHWWFEHDEDEYLGLLVNGERAWLMYAYVKDDDFPDLFFSTRNPDYDRPETTMLEFIIDNGQKDCYPLSLIISLADALRACEFFIRNGGMAPWLTWHNDEP
jgi:hypothetical protein